MHWVIQKNIFKPGNFDLLVNALDRLEIKHTSVFIKNGTSDMTPDVIPAGKIYICGAIKLTKIANERGWSPGSFLNEKFNFDLWREKLGVEMLNFDLVKGSLATVPTGGAEKFFIRPLEDNKAFDGMVIDQETLAEWRRDPAKAYLSDLEVIVSPVKTIYREYRLFVVDKKVVTGSVYKVGGRPEISPLVDADAIVYAEAIIAKWTPADSFVIDIALGEHGMQVIEFNNINSSGFYASDVAKYAAAIQAAYA
ncbi:MAG: ATP-grasp domain-containing protein [Pseudomonadota bacterium]